MIQKSDWRFRLWCWFAVHILKVPYTIKFTPPDQEALIAIGFAWSRDAATKMQNNYITLPQTLSRTQRRALNRAAKGAAKDVAGSGSDQ